MTRPALIEVSGAAAPAAHNSQQPSNRARVLFKVSPQSPAMSLLALPPKFKVCRDWNLQIADFTWRGKTSNPLPRPLSPLRSSNLPPTADESDARQPRAAPTAFPRHRHATSARAAT